MVNETQHDQTIATHLAMALQPRPNLEPETLRIIADDLLRATRNYLRITNGFCEFEEWGLCDLLEGRYPRPLLARLYAALNNPRVATDPIREPSEADLERYQNYFGCMLGDYYVNILLPLPGSDPAMDPDKADEALYLFRGFVAAMPFRSLNLKYVSIGLAADRLSMFAPIRPVRPRDLDSPNEEEV